MMIGATGTARILIAGAAMALGVTVSTLPAQAQFFGFWGARSFAYGNPGIRPGELASIVADEGMHLVGRPYRNGNVFVVDAVDQRGWQHRLIIDAWTGDIIQSYGRGQGTPQQYAPVAPPPRVARATPGEPYVIPGIGGDERPATPKVKPKVKAIKKPPVIARSPVQTRPLEAPPASAIVPQPAPEIVPVKPSDPPAVLEAAPKPEASPAPAEQPVAAAPVVAPVVPSVEPVVPVVAPEVPSVAPVVPAEAPAVQPEKGKVNDIPVAPLD